MIRKYLARCMCAVIMLQFLLPVRGLAKVLADSGKIPEKPNLDYPVYLPVIARIRTNMGYIPAGEFKMGGDPNSPIGTWAPYEEPLHTVYLDAYYIDVYEVTNGEYAKCEAAGGCKWHYPQYSATREPYYGNPTYANYPVIYVKWFEANDYCKWVGKRLPTEAEWEKAARGASDTREYPWGDWFSDCTLSNHEVQNPIGYFDHYCVGDTSPVGSYPAGASVYGVLDMAGNVSEWVNDWFGYDYYSNSPYSNPTGPTEGAIKVIRGGDWASSMLDIRLPHRNYYDINYASFDSLGFRCALSAAH